MGGPPRSDGVELSICGAGLMARAETLPALRYCVSILMSFMFALR